MTHWVHPEVVAYLREFGTVVMPAEPGQVWPRSDVARHAGEARALIACMADRVDDALLAACPKLEIVSATLKGFDNFDVAACTRRGVWLAILPDMLTAPAAELAVGLSIGLMRNVGPGDRLVRSGAFAGWRPELYGTGLRGSRIGIAGMGPLGRAVARLFAAFGPERILGHDRDPLSPADEDALGVRSVGWETLLAGSDLVVLCLPLTTETRQLVGGSALELMPVGSHLVNIGRGSVVDEQAVAAALDTGRLAGYAADVFAFEDWARPDRPGRIPAALLAHPRTLFTPHLGSAVDAVRRDMSLEAARQVRQVLDGGAPDHAVNRPRRSAR